MLSSSIRYLLLYIYIYLLIMLFPLIIYIYIPIDDIPSKSQLVYGACLMLLLRPALRPADGQVLHQLYVLLFMLPSGELT